MPSAPVFPPARVGREVPSSFTPLPTVGVAGAAPSTRQLSFSLANSVVNRRTTVSFGPFTAPAIVKWIQFGTSAQATPPDSGLELGVALGSVTETDVLRDGVKGWKPIYEFQKSPSTETTVDIKGLLNAAGTVGLGPLLVPLDHIVSQPSFFLTVTVYANAGTGFRWTGSINLVEGVSDQALRNFL